MSGLSDDEQTAYVVRLGQFWLRQFLIVIVPAGAMGLIFLIDEDPMSGASHVALLLLAIAIGLSALGNYAWGLADDIRTARRARLSPTRSP